MVKQARLLVAILLAFEANSTQIKNVETKETIISPYGLLDDAQADLEELRETLEGTILVSHDKLDSLANDARNHRYVTIRGGSNKILYEYRLIDAELTTIKELANTAGKDISSCLANREELLGTVPYDYLDELSECIPTTTPYIDDLLENSKYYVDVTVTKVNELEFQLGRCEADSLLCISPVVSQIEQQMVELPQSIAIEVTKTGEQYEVVKVLITNCNDPIVADAVSAGTTILSEISDCVNEVLGF